MKKAEHVTIVIFGASGDLTKRKLIPALFQLAKDGLLTEKTTIVGFARREKSHEQFRVEIEDALVEFARSKPEAGSRELKVFSSCCYYQTGNYDSSKSFHDLKNLIDKLDEERGIDSSKANRLWTGVCLHWVEHVKRAYLVSYGPVLLPPHHFLYD